MREVPMEVPSQMCGLPFIASPGRRRRREVEEEEDEEKKEEKKEEDMMRRRRMQRHTSHKMFEHI